MKCKNERCTQHATIRATIKRYMAIVDEVMYGIS